MSKTNPKNVSTIALVCVPRAAGPVVRLRQLKEIIGSLDSGGAGGSAARNPERVPAPRIRSSSNAPTACPFTRRQRTCAKPSVVRPTKRLTPEARARRPSSILQRGQHADVRTPSPALQRRPVDRKRDRLRLDPNAGVAGAKPIEVEICRRKAMRRTTSTCANTIRRTRAIRARTNPSPTIPATMPTPRSTMTSTRS